MAKLRSFKIDFFCVTRNGERRHTALAEVLEAVEPGGLAGAVALQGNEDEKHQLRIARRSRGGAVTFAVFGRCRYNEALTQGDTYGSEAEVQLKPGHGLVEKNYMLFVPKRNLVIYQRNPNGSHHSKLQAYFNRLADGRFVLEPILERDAYQRLIDGGELKGIELSVATPQDPSLYQDVLTSGAAKLLKDCGALRGRISLSVGRNRKRLKPALKDALQSLARSGLATVARARTEDVDHPIDLIADRLVKSATVESSDAGRVEPNAYFSALDEARSDAEDALRAFYG